MLEVLKDPDVQTALPLTAIAGLTAVVINTVFGVGMSLLLGRYAFPGRRALSALLDLPLSVSPIVVGLAIVLVYGGRDGWFGPTRSRSRPPAAPTSSTTHPLVDQVLGSDLEAGH